MSDEELNELFALKLSNTEQDQIVRYEVDARSGDWALLTCNVYSSLLTGFEAGESFGLSLEYVAGNNGDLELYIDDFRLQPRYSESMGYVYDTSNYRLLAMIDDQNFALLYQYNPEGKLIRKLKETERGVKVLSEGQYNNGSKE